MNKQSWAAWPLVTWAGPVLLTATVSLMAWLVVHTIRAEGNLTHADEDRIVQFVQQSLDARLRAIETDVREIRNVQNQILLQIRSTQPAVASSR